MDRHKNLATLQAHIERDLKKIGRWVPFQKSSNARPQTTLCHTVTIQLAGMAVIQAEQRHNPTPFNAALIYEMLALHDFGEMVRANEGFDIALPDKSVQSDRDEIDYFTKMTSDLPPLFKNLVRARFFAQFKEKSLLTESELNCVMSHGEKLELELNIFKAVEHFDYFLFAYNEYASQGNKRIIWRVFNDSLPRFKELAAILPGFRKEIITPEILTWGDEVLERWKGCSEEQVPNRFETNAPL